MTGFLSSHGGRDFREAVQAVNEHGYVVDAIQVSAEHFTPQSRPRLFMLALRDNLAGDLMALPDDKLRYRSAVIAGSTLRPDSLRALMTTEGELRWGAIEFPSLSRRTLTLADVVDWERNDWWDEGRVETFLAEMGPLHQARLRSMMGQHGPRVATAYRRVRNGRSVYELRADGLAGCLRTAVGGSSKQIVVVVDGGDVRVRWMAPVEYGRLQGVPDINELDGFKDNELRTAFGDAVCVPAYRWIANHALGPLLGRVASERPEQPHQLALV